VETADRAEADMHTSCKFLDEQALFTGLFHMYAATNKELRDSHQHSSKEIAKGRKVVRKQNKTNVERDTETLTMIAAARKRRGHLRPTQTHGRWK
jgi:hypothetical protein